MHLSVPKLEPELKVVLCMGNYEHFIPSLTRFSCSVNTWASDVPTLAIHSRGNACALILLPFCHSTRTIAITLLHPFSTS